MPEENVKPIGGKDAVLHDEPPEDALEKAKSWGMTHCLIIGHDGQDKLHIGGSFSDMPVMLWLIMRALWFLQRKMLVIEDHINAG